MPIEVQECECKACRQTKDHPDWQVHHQMNIFLSWAGKPLLTFETMLAYIRGTVNATGLKVHAFLVDQVYQKGIHIAKEVVESINLQYQDACPRWNYTIRPQFACA